MTATNISQASRPIPEEIFILVYPQPPHNDKTPISQRPFWTRQEAELCAKRLGRGVEVVGYHIIRTVEL